MSTSSLLGSLLGNSSSSVNLTQILEAALGASSPGIDVNGAVSAAVTAAQAPEQAWQNQETSLQNQSSALSQLQSTATSLDSDMQSLNSLTGPLSASTVNSSNSSIITGSAASGTAPGNYVVVVNSLATPDSWSSSTMASDTAALPAGTVTITTANGPTTITTGSGVNTLDDLASSINGDNLGVTASVITDATGARLSIVSSTSGSASDFTVSSSNSPSFGFSEAVQGQNASLTVNGLSISSATNTVTGAVPGVSLNLYSTSSSPVTLTVSPNTTQITNAINQFVSDYNSLISSVNTQFAYTAGSGQGILATDPTVRNLQTALMQSVSYTYSPSSGTTTMPNLSSLGITVNSDGTLSVNNSTLSSALQNNFSDVQSFFQGTSQNGFANALDQQLTSFTSPGSGAFTVDLQSISSQVSDYQTDITNFQTNVIQPLQTQLQAEYSKAEIALQQLPSELRNVDAELGINTSSSNG